MDSIISALPKGMREAYENARPLNKEEAEAIIEKLMTTRPESPEPLFTKNGYPECAIYEGQAIEASPEWKKEQMIKKAKNGIVDKDNFIKFDDGTWIDLDPTMQLKPAFDVKVGEKVKVIIIKEQ